MTDSNFLHAPQGKALPLLSVKNLSVALESFGEQNVIVRDLNFSLQHGRTLGIVGESGCGKSITALAIMGLLPESASMQGQVTLQSQQLTTLSEKQMQQLRGNRIAMIFQEPKAALNPLYTIGRQLAEPLRLHKGLSWQQASKRVIELLERVGIQQAENRLSSYPHELSGGQCQRMLIAMALACNPDLLIADEPTTALDMILQRQILDLLNELVDERQMGMVLISHDLAVISEYTDDVLVMLDGAVVECGRTEEVFATPQHSYTKKLLQAHDRLMIQTHLEAVSAAPAEHKAATLATEAQSHE